MRKKRLRGGKREQQTTAVPDCTAHVRNRLVASLAAVALTVLGASALGIVDATRDLTDSRRLVGLAEAGGDAVTLAHSLADERDAMVLYVAGGRSDTTGSGLTDELRDRVDRQLPAVRAAVPVAVRDRLDALPEVRRRALSGPGDAEAAFTAYSDAIRALHGVPGTLAARLPGPGGAAALAPLGRAVDEAAATRGLLLAALATGGKPPALGAAAQRAELRERAARADFTDRAPATVRDTFRDTVTGPQITAADEYLARLAAHPQLTAADLALPKDGVRTALTARVDRMRDVETSLAADQVPAARQLRDDDLRALELRGGVAAGCLLLALCLGLGSARSVTRPLTALRDGARRVAADPAAKEQLATGRRRDDEFADIARSLDALRETVGGDRERIATLEAERTRLIGARRSLAEERDALRAQAQDLTERLAGLSGRVHGTFVSLSLRTLGLVERQLSVIESMEANEADPDRLEVLFKLDHLATRMRRHSENLLVLAGAEHSSGHHGPVPLLDVLRASISEIERYERVRIHSLPPGAQLAGFAADDVSHLVAELLENGTAFSPPDVQVQVSGWLLESGELMLSVQDEGIGMAPERLEELNTLLADPDPRGPRPGGGDQHDRPALGLGLYVVARLAARHGVRVQLRDQRPGGVAAVVVLPRTLLPDGPPVVTDFAAAPPVPGASAPPPVHLPGSIAEANSHELPPRSQHTVGPRRSDPLIEAAERAIRLNAIPGQQPTVLPGQPTIPGQPTATGRHARHAAPPPAPSPPPPAAPAPPPDRPAAPAPGPAVGLTGTGLPKRTPKTVPRKPPAPRVRQGVDAEALRRKLAGFQQGARDGRRDVEAELVDRDTDQHQAGARDEGGTVEEARG
ncbi:nitrate- and nitrite sensing domain-containing protein [Streptomyces sp. QH1-20]|uniref:sensor histidine kinase n=1 Tax=Streptomyces sp. QH1-20 TaxID=3240934 RepID=UPI00351167DE